LAKTNREQSLIVHALFGKWNLLYCLALTQNDIWSPFIRYAMAGGGGLKLDRCDRDHIRIEEHRILVFNNVIAALRKRNPTVAPGLG
jgi:hypothetical protein